MIQRKPRFGGLSRAMALIAVLDQNGSNSLFKEFDLVRCWLSGLCRADKDQHRYNRFDFQLFRDPYIRGAGSLDCIRPETVAQRNREASARDPSKWSLLFEHLFKKLVIAGNLDQSAAISLWR